MKSVVRFFLLSLICAVTIIPEPVEAGSHSAAPVQHVYRHGRPVCRAGWVGPGCVAPVRKSVRAVGRVAVGAVRAVGRVARGAVRAVGRAALVPFRLARAAVRGTGRLLFGRRCCRL